MNNNIIKISRLLLFVMLIGLCHGVAGGKTLKDTTGQVIVCYEPLADGTIKVTSAVNKLSGPILLLIDKKWYRINAECSVRLDKIARRNVRFAYKKGGYVLWRSEVPAVKSEKSAVEKSGKEKAKDPEKQKRTNNTRTQTDVQYEQ